MLYFNIFIKIVDILSPLSWPAIPSRRLLVSPEELHGQDGPGDQAEENHCTVCYLKGS